MKKTLLILALVLNCSLMFAQDYSFKNYDWSEKQTTIEVPEQFKKENEVILERNIKVEILVVGKGATQYTLNHEKKYINSDDAIERNNKVYIPFGKNENVLVNKARVILKNNKIITLNNKDIKEEVDEEKGLKYSYFAINGLEKGAIIETLSIIEEAPELDGKTIRMQKEYPIVDLNFEMIFPNYLVLKTKSYNGLSDATIDDKKIDTKSVLSIVEKNIVGLEDDQKSSNWKANLKMFRYKLDQNLNSRAKNLYNFKEFSTNLFDRLNPELDKKQSKSIEEFCQSIPKSNDVQEQIWNIENKVKKTIIYDKYVGRKETLTDVIKSKQASQFDILLLYTAIFKNFKIENNVVLTSDRFKIPFDKEFESYENLSEVLFYFPSIKKYLTPTELQFRIPLFPEELGNNNGLFIKSKMFAGVAMGIGEVNFIEVPGVDVTHDEMNITVDFTKDIENPLITNNNIYGGYSGFNFQPIKDFVSAEQYKSILKDFAENYSAKTEYKSLTTENDGIEFIGKKQFTMNLTYDGKDLIQKAGDNYLFSIGLTIGKQMELYQENKRTLPIEIQYPHAYLRKIKIILPAGAIVKNLEKFNMDFKTQINGKTEAAFTSKYIKTNNEINIENVEYYNIVNYPLATFEEYKAVINAAADFNKIVIVVTK
jgi:hypothetical protein